METGWKLRLPRLLRPSLYSCRHDNAFDEVQEPVFLANRDVLPLLPLPKDPCSFTLSVGCGCRPKRWSITVSSTQSTTTTMGSEGIESDDSDSVDSFRKMLARITSQNRAKSLGSDDGNQGRVVSSVSRESKSCGRRSCECYRKKQFSGEKAENRKALQTVKEKKKKSSLRSRKKRSNKPIDLLSRSSSGTGWFSSEEDAGVVIDKESEEFFSAKSTVSSGSSFQTTIQSERGASARRRSGAERRKQRKYPESLKKPSYSPPERASECSPTNFPDCTEMVRESVAVVKRSMDPYGDFKESIVEMIVAKKMVGRENLQELLQCFLSLNSTRHHHVIIKVFRDIWDALFCDN